MKIIARLRGGLIVIHEPRRRGVGEREAITRSVISLRALVAFSRQFLSLIFRVAASRKSNRRAARATRETHLPLSRVLSREQTHPPRIRSIGGNGARERCFEGCNEAIHGRAWEWKVRDFYSRGPPSSPDEISKRFNTPLVEFLPIESTAVALRGSISM